MGALRFFAVVLVAWTRNAADICAIRRIRQSETEYQ